MNKKVIIVGGGFGGLQAAKKLGNVRGVDVTVVDRRNHHLFQPLLYQVAMAGLSPAEIATPIRTILSKYNNVQVSLSEVDGVDPQNNTVTYDGIAHKFDYLVLACGAKHSYFGRNEWEPFAPGLKTLEQATEIRRRVLTAFEMAEKASDPAQKQKYLTFVIVGAGPTGVELAGAIAEINRFTLGKDFKNLSPQDTKVILVEAGDRVLSSFARPLSQSALHDLNKLGVEVKLNSRVTQIDDDSVTLINDKIFTHTVLWAAGVKPSSLNKCLNSPMDPQGRVKVQQDLSLEVNKNIFVIGDQAHFVGQNGFPLPGLAPVAIQQGKHVGRQIKADLKAQPRVPFHYMDKGQMATIGRLSAVMQFKGLKARGLVAWLAWLLIHIYYLIGFKNRLFVFMDWFWQYLYYHRGARLITQRDWESYKPKSSSQLQTSE